MHGQLITHSEGKLILMNLKIRRHVSMRMACSNQFPAHGTHRQRRICHAMARSPWSNNPSRTAMKKILASIIKCIFVLECNLLRYYYSIKRDLA